MPLGHWWREIRATQRPRLSEGGAIEGVEDGADDTADPLFVETFVSSAASAEKLELMSIKAVNPTKIRRFVLPETI